MPTPSPTRFPIFAPGRLGSLALRNRILRTAAFEGMCPGGIPGPALVEHHRRMAAGGAALTTVAYCSISPDGRTYGHQMWMSEETREALRPLTDAVHREGAAASIQLGHCGGFASTAVIGGRPLGPSVTFNTYGLSFSRAMHRDDIGRVVRDFGRAAQRAREAGFDAVEVHAGHGYLLSQFLSPATNRRRDDWGGPLAHRLRFPLDVLRAVRAAVGPDFPVVVKLNLRDGFRGGLELDEAVEAARAFEAEGADALLPSGGFVSRTPFYMLRGRVPVREMVAVQDSLLRRVGLTLFGGVFVQTYPFHEAFLREDALKVRAAVRLPVILTGGLRTLAGMNRARRDGFDFVALGRALILDPDLPRRLQAGEATDSECDSCNRCIAEMDRGGVRCACAADGRFRYADTP